MWSTIVTFVVTVCAWLPEITVVLKFCTSLISFVITARLGLRRVRRWLDRRRSATDRPAAGPRRIRGR
jgi:membrane protein implicated in regulation of membrane protease activity